MKKEMNMNETLIFNNEFRWAYVWQTILHSLKSSSWIIVADIVIDVVAYIGGGLPLFSNLRLEIIGFIGLNVFLVMFYALLYFQRLRTGKYSITGNNLIVHERHFSGVTDLTIPIARITNVYYRPRWGGWKYYFQNSGLGKQPTYCPFRFLEITVEGQNYMLFSFAHADELYNELRKRIDNNTNL